MAGCVLGCRMADGAAIGGGVLTTPYICAHPEPYDPPEVPIKRTLKRRLFYTLLSLDVNAGSDSIAIYRVASESLVRGVLSQNRYN